MENAPIDIVQAPFNVVDTSIVSSGWLDKLAGAGVEVHVRSIFMQGLLLMDRSSIPDKFKRWSVLWDHWHNNLNTYGLDALSECINFVNSFSNVARVVVGIESALQLQQVMVAINHSTNPLNWSQMTCHDDMLINPSNWTKL
jgi:aryl-alcohol dehydrogenase-like predicted oxidoreductase